jgi:hypothetical protein
MVPVRTRQKFGVRGLISRRNLLRGYITPQKFAKMDIIPRRNLLRGV